MAEHALFHGGMEEMSHYLISCLPIGTIYGHHEVVKASGERASGESLVESEGQKLRAIIDSFVAPFVSHVRSLSNFVLLTRLMPFFTIFPWVVTTRSGAGAPSTLLE